MSRETANKVLVKRPTRDSTNELVSTQMLKVILSSRDTTDREAIEEAADTAVDGVLARDPDNGNFEIIAYDELQAILNDTEGLPRLTRPADATLEPLRDYADHSEVALVSTHALRKVLDGADKRKNVSEIAELQEGEFNPYARG
jgi:hypothetical protein